MRNAIASMNMRRDTLRVEGFLTVTLNGPAVVSVSESKTIIVSTTWTAAGFWSCYRLSEIDEQKYIVKNRLTKIDELKYMGKNTLTDTSAGIFNRRGSGIESTWTTVPEDEDGRAVTVGRGAVTVGTPPIGVRRDCEEEDTPPT